MMLYQRGKSSRKIIAVFIVVLMLIGSVAFAPSGIYAAEAGQGDTSQPVIAVENGGIEVIKADELLGTEEVADAEPTEVEPADKPEGSSGAEAAFEAAPGEADEPAGGSDDTSGSAPDESGAVEADVSEPTEPESADKPEGSSEDEAAFEVAPGEADDSADEANYTSEAALDEQPPVMALSLLSTTAAGYFTYTISDTVSDAAITSDTAITLGATITGYTGSESDVVIPDTIDGYTVTAIGDNAFIFNKGIRTVTIPASVTSIGNCAFEDCTSLTNITIANGVNSIGIAAFVDCTKLTSITIPGSVSDIGLHAFENCSNLTNIAVDATNEFYSSVDGVLFNKEKSVLIVYPAGISSGAYTIPQGVASIDDYAFYGCSNLAGVAIPNSATHIGTSAFEGCGLTSVTIPESVIRISDSAFEDCSSLTSVTIANGVNSIYFSAFRGCSSLTNVTIPDSVTSIASGAFEDCTSLTNVTIPDSVTGIAHSAFKGCTSLTNVTIPESVTFIGNSAFWYCTSLTNVTIPDSVTSIGSSAFYACTSLTRITIPDSVGFISSDLFSHCTSLTNLTIPDSVISIASDAFSGSGLTSITIPGSVRQIGFRAFRGCANLTNIAVDATNEFYSSVDGVLFNKEKSVLVAYPARISSEEYTIPDSVTSINGSAFFNCTSLTSITIPASVTSIEYWAFYKCSRLSIATFNGNAPSSFGDDVFAYTASDFTIQYYSGKTGWTSPTWNGYRTVMIGAPAHISVAGITGVPSTAEVKTPLALSGTVNPSDATNRTIVWSIVNAGSTGATIISDSVLHTTAAGAAISGSALYTTAAGSVTVRATIVDGISIGTNYTQDFVIVVKADNDFTYTVSGTNAAITGYTGSEPDIVIPDTIDGYTVTAIGDSAFENCTNLVGVEIPDGVTSIGAGAFVDCDSLTNVTIPDSVTSIGNAAFHGSGLTSITIPDSVTSIGSDAFLSCGSLTNVTIPGSITRISNSAFAYCTSLTSITIPASVTSIGSDAFLSCRSLTSITIPASVSSIGNYAFYGCSRLSTATFDGNAPLSFAYSVFSGAASNFTIQYYSGTMGWTSPTWTSPTGETYPTVMIGAPVYISVAGITGVPSTATAKTPLALSGTVNPSDATNRTIVWSVVNAGSTGATIISDSALHTTAAGASISGSALYPTAAGSVTVRATIVDGISVGMNYTQDFVIVVKADNVASYTITYNANGGSGAPAAQTKTPGHALLLSSTVPARAGYTFLGWAAGSATANVQYQPRMLFVADANTTLYAVWAANDQTVVRIGSVSAAKGSTVKVPVTITNSPGISAAILEFNFPAELALITFEGTGGMPFESGDFTTGSGVGIITLMEDAGYTDELLTTLVFAVSDNATEGMKKITINMANESVSLGDVEGFDDIQFTPVSGSVTVSNMKVGDVNGDGKITATDLTYMKRAIVKRPGFVQNAAMDVNRDGEITATDLTYLKRAIVNRPGFVL